MADEKPTSSDGQPEEELKGPLGPEQGRDPVATLRAESQQHHEAAELFEGYSLDSLVSTEAACVYDIHSTDADVAADTSLEAFGGVKESGTISRILHHPLTDMRRIRQRQGLIQAFCESAEREEMTTLKTAVYRISAGLNALFQIVVVPTPHEEHGDDDEEKGMKMTLLEAYKHYCKPSFEALFERALQDFHYGYEALNALQPLLAGNASPFISRLAPEFTALQDMLLPVTREYILSGSSWDMQSILTRMASVNAHVTLNLGVFLEFAAVVVRDGYGQARFDDEQPANYKEGWSLARQKTTGYEGRNQVLNDSPADTPTTAFTGSNMSGKSFQLKQALLMQLAAQSFGYVPARMGNFRVYDSFHYLDRATTDSRGDLSAFGSEIRDWDTAIARFGTRPFICCDEGYSTASAGDQDTLLQASALFVAEKNGRFFVATHNEEFIAGCAGPNVVRYYLDTTVDAGGLPHYHHILREGVGDSLALVVARGQKFPESIIRDAQSYYDGVMPPHVEDVPEKKYPLPQRRSPAEREALKGQRGSALAVTGEASPSNRRFMRLSEDGDFKHASTFIPDVPGYDDDPKNLLRMIMHGVRVSPEDLLERQDTFAALAENDRYEEVCTRVNGVEALLKYFSTIMYGGRNFMDFTEMIAPQHLNIDEYLAYFKIMSLLFASQPQLVEPLKKAIEEVEALITLRNKLTSGAKRFDVREISTMLAQRRDETKSAPFQERIRHVMPHQRLITQFREVARAIGEDAPRQWEGKITLERIEALERRFTTVSGTLAQDVRYRYAADIAVMKADIAEAWQDCRLPDLYSQGPSFSVRDVSDAIVGKILKLRDEIHAMPSRSLFECNFEEIRPHLKALVKANLEGDRSLASSLRFHEVHELDERTRTVLALSLLVNDEDPIEALTRLMRSYDSVPLFQSAHKLQESAPGSVTFACDRYNLYDGTQNLSDQEVSMAWEHGRKKLLALCGEEEASRIDQELERHEYERCRALLKRIRVVGGREAFGVARDIFENTVSHVLGDLRPLEDEYLRLTAEVPSTFLQYPSDSERYLRAIRNAVEGSASSRVDALELKRALEWLERAPTPPEGISQISQMFQYENIPRADNEIAAYISKAIEGSTLADFLVRIDRAREELGGLGKRAVALCHQNKLDISEKPYIASGYIPDVRDLLGQRYSQRLSGLYRNTSNPFKDVSHELQAVRTMFYAGHVIAEQGHCPVDFNSTGELHLRDTWSLFKEQGAQVRNEVEFKQGEGIKLVTGANMSGKTFWLKQLTAGLLWAQTTGYAPALSATMPMIDRVVYLDRVRSKSDRHLSAFGNELEYLQQLLGAMNSGGTNVVLGAIDEMGSTTSPRYQDAIIVAMMLESLRTGTPTALATHSHPAVDALVAEYPGRVNAYHFETHVEPGKGKDGGEKFVRDFAMREGHQPSQGIRVARSLNFAPRILHFAELLRAGTQAHA